MVGTLQNDFAWIDPLTEIRFSFAKVNPRDWIDGTQGMPLEIEGAYWRFCVRLYKNGRPLLDDDVKISKLMELSLRVWKRVKATLLEAGKIIARNGCLTNLRFEKERAERAANIRAQSQAAIDTHEKRKAIAKVSAEIAESSGETSAKLAANLDKKPNENNDLGLIDHGHTKRNREIEDREEKDSSANADSPSGDDGATIEDKLKAMPKSKSDLLLDLVVTTEAKRVEKEREAMRGFEDFYKLYPRKVGRKAAEKFWRRLPYTSKVKAYLALKQQAPALATKAKDPKGNFCPHPATWLSQGRWDDEIETEAPRVQEKQPWQKTEADKTESLIDYIAENY